MRVLLFTSATDVHVVPAFWDMAKILERFAEKVYVITATTDKPPTPLTNIFIERHFEMSLRDHIARSGLLAKLLQFPEHEVRTFLELYRLRNEVDLVLSFQSVSILTMLLSRLVRKPSLLYIGGNPKETLFKSRSVFSGFLATVSILLWRIQTRLATEVVAISASILGDFKIGKHVHYAYVRLLDERFRITKPLSERDNVLGFVGRLEEEKGVTVLVDAFYLASQKAKLKLLIVGDGSLRQEIGQTISERGLLGSVTVTGWVSNVNEFLNEIKLLVLPSKTEGVSSVILEAMATGTPILATPVGESGRILGRNSRGFLLESTEPICMSKCIIGLFTDSERLFHMSEKALIWVKKNFSAEQILDQWRRIFNELKRER